MKTACSCEACLAAQHHPSLQECKNHYCIIAKGHYFGCPCQACLSAQAHHGHVALKKEQTKPMTTTIALACHIETFGKRWFKPI